MADDPTPENAPTNGDYAVSDEGGIVLTPAETDALAEWLCNRWLDSDWVEWGDVPFLAEAQVDRLCEAVNDYIGRLTEATRKWTIEFDIDPAHIFDALNRDPSLSAKGGES